MRILVTGGAGFIGSAFVRRLLTGGAERVTVLDALTYSGNLANLAPVAGHADYAFVRGDIRDPDTVSRVMAGHDAVVHFAAESHVDRSIAGALPFVSTNVQGTQVLLDAALRHGVGRFVHVSTDEVYGSIDEGHWREDQPLAPSSPYSASKAGSDLLALACHRTHGLDVVITRCSNNYGPYQYCEKLIPLFVTNLLQGKRVPLYGDGGNVREWLHVDDHCRGIETVLRHGRAGEIYHIGGGAELTNRELVGRLLAACGADWSAVDHVADRKGHDRRYALSAEKIRDELGFAPEIDFTEGLAATVAWYRENRDWWRAPAAEAVAGA
ncbi:dTDP-glucose 4,6-dehydratase [Streptomyces litchfieldiae]|uniref:dTDP-glucose 4,6-dehydratase n=1 Tax=Streptomyces litchfieldiae TaxID=3075543 RepID=A0ABU2MXM4_9ACTN|nr:dTDP-glucose 4,6-dehydratase [Streptomyces sp. DSM 44938]MDT0346416.1 dTDP-glucose 4,6-dehydratase [Streptomyces sp. DSM 44938]